MSAEYSDSPAFHVDLEASDFPSGSPLNGDFRLRVRWDELIWAAIAVGKWQSDVFVYGRYSAAEAIHRAGSIYAYCAVDAGRLVMTPAFATLDTTEKAITSYYIGMAMAKVYAEKVLGVPWLMHISRYESRWTVDYAGQRRPDLFGPTPGGDWTVVEAKGRARVTSGLRGHMRDQKSAVRSINGLEPSFRVGVATRRVQSRVSLVVVDPPASDDAEDLTLDPAIWLADYFNPFIDLFSRSSRTGDSGVRVVELPGTGVELGLPAEVVPLLLTLRQRVATRTRPGPRRSDTQPELTERSLFNQISLGDRGLMDDLLGGLSGARNVGGLSDGLVVRAPIDSKLRFG